VSADRTGAATLHGDNVAMHRFISAPAAWQKVDAQTSGTGTRQRVCIQTALRFGFT
jgi:hypothetical protein